MIEHRGVKHLDALLLDSSLITRTIPKKYYDCKIIRCGSYIQIYKRDRNILHISDKDYELNEKYEKARGVNKILQDYDVDDLSKTKKRDEITLKKIDERNIYRSKNNMCRLIMTNNLEFKTFITLTFAEDVQDITIANKEFANFIRKMRRVYNNFKYISVLEFTKKDRIHYHMITNIGYNNDILINENISLKKLYNKLKGKTIQINKNNFKKAIINNKMNDFDICLRIDMNKKWHNTKKTYNYKTKELKLFKTVKYWNNGYSNVLELENICGNNVSAYMSKYMTKDIDDRLFGFRRYTYSQNLIKPQIEYLNSNNEIDNFIIDLELKTNELKYYNHYYDKFGNEVEFFEIKLQ